MGASANDGASGDRCGRGGVARVHHGVRLGLGFEFRHGREHIDDDPNRDGGFLGAGRELIGADRDIGADGDVRASTDRQTSPR